VPTDYLFDFTISLMFFSARYAFRRLGDRFVRKINQFSSTFALFEDSAWLRALAFLTCYFSFQIVNLVLLLKHCINGPILRIKSRWRSAATTIKACSVHIEPGLLMCFQIRLTFHCVHYSGFHLLRLLGVEMKVGADNTSKHFL
jgi:hypothetical protein